MSTEKKAPADFFERLLLVAERFVDAFEKFVSNGGGAKAGKASASKAEPKREKIQREPSENRIRADEAYVKSVKTKDGNPWLNAGLDVDGGDKLTWVSTKDDDLANALIRAHNHKYAVVVEWEEKKNGEYTNRYVALCTPVDPKAAAVAAGTEDEDEEVPF